MRLIVPQEQEERRALCASLCLKNGRKESSMRLIVPQEQGEQGVLCASCLPMYTRRGMYAYMPPYVHQEGYVHQVASLCTPGGIRPEVQ